MEQPYDAIMEELGLPFGDTGDWPEGIISHAAGSTSDGGWTVVDVWESQEAFDRFLASSLGPAFEKVGGVPLGFAYWARSLLVGSCLMSSLAARPSRFRAPRA